MNKTKTKTKSTKSKSWREAIPIHPAASLFPPYTPTELQALADDIKEHGLKVPIVLWNDNEGKRYVLDGVNRLDAAEIAGLDIDLPNTVGDVRVNETFQEVDDPYDFVLSVNLTRRHLSAADKRKLIAKVLAARPELSDRAVADKTKSSHPTVAKVRRTLAAKSGGKNFHPTKRTGKDGKQQTATKKVAAKAAAKVETKKTKAENKKPASEWASELAAESREIPVETIKAEFAKDGETTESHAMHCSFCGKSQHEVRQLIVGNDGAFICNDDVLLSLGVILEKGATREELAEIESLLNKAKAQKAESAKAWVEKNTPKVRKVAD